MRRLGYRPELDGVRGIAISLVLADHYFGLHEGGSTGVRLFFVLSGFLITTLLLEEHAVTGSIGLRGFYGRRARRLFPALAAMLLLYFGFQIGRPGIALVAERVALAGSYVSNFAVSFRYHDLISGTALGPLWSLAQEEQFYAFWPLLLAVGVRSRRLLGYLLLALAALLAYQRVLAVNGASSSRLYYGPDTNPLWLLAGATLAVARHRSAHFRFPPMLGVLGVACAAWYLCSANFGWHWVGATFSTMILAASYTAVVGAACGSNTFTRSLSLRPVVWLGSISYSVYLWQIIAIALGTAIGIASGLGSTGWRLLSVAIALAFGWLSWRFIEQPFRARRSARLEDGFIGALAAIRDSPSRHPPQSTSP